MLAALERVPGIPLAIAAIDDLICMKLSAIAGRGAARDFWDLHEMVSSRAKTLRAALEAYEVKYVTEDIGHVVRSLVYFADAEAGPMPEGLTDAHWARIQGDFKEWARDL